MAANRIYDDNEDDVFKSVETIAVLKPIRLRRVPSLADMVPSYSRTRTNVKRLSRKLSQTVITGLNLSSVDTPDLDQITEESKQLVRDYILNRIKRSGLYYSSKLPPAPEVHECSAVSNQVQLIGSELERIYPELYRSISRQINVTMSNEEIVRKTFVSIGEYMMKGEIHWGKIVALFALIGGIAVDCVQQGHPEYVHKLIEHFGVFVNRNLANWISIQGGWEDIVNSFKSNTDTSMLWIISGIGAMIGFIATLLATVKL
ncbi:bcl-2-related ovarian killer protein-like isoform X2 [Tubulanus polymorphus]|uniref:bcl-2-related ovarian killer protein-like isoform X2 n=1 Tax=Tubulanus polymorphus TaxID=672921 RepID=UPI003DA254A9